MKRGGAGDRLTVSVIIPCYNQAQFLPAALDSVLAQTRPPLEVIVVDDGSTDATGAAAEGFAPRVRLLSQAQQGIGAARNTGVAAARGELIAFLDADDLWTPNSLALRLAPLEADRAVGCVFGQTEQFISPELDDEARAGLQCPEGAVVARFAAAMLIRRSAYDRVGPFSTALRVGEMIDWAARLDDLPITVVNVEALVLRRRIHGANTVLRRKSEATDYLRALQASIRRRSAAGGRSTP
jgi:glycosyltransferase involved in cell wall biosynthesis